MLFLVLAACPQVNSTPCSQDSECTATQRCRRGACGPICLDDSECGAQQACLNGVCGPRPVCAQDVDCSTGFVCAGGQCQCTADTSCAANQQCVSGTCQTSKRCTADADCLGTGSRCELTQGLCLPRCTAAADCAPTLNATVAALLYSCEAGTCTRRCTTDLTCGASGFICQSGLCALAQCSGAAPCPSGEYCTSGRCEGTTTCSDASTCPRNDGCRVFTTAECPASFDCSQKVCLELPRCLSDGDCSTGLPGTPASTPTGYCESGHCQPSGTCTAGDQCGANKDCIGGVCVPSRCRGAGSCDGGACVDGACVAAPAPGDLTLARVLPSRATLLVGDSLHFQLSVASLSGATYPLEQAVWTVLDDAGVASATDAGMITALAAGTVRIRASVAGSAVTPAEASLTVIPALTAGRRVVVLDSETREPLAGVKVFGCLSADCSAPLLATTDGLGQALFPSLGAGPATFTATAGELRSDGLPAHERASILSTSSSDVLLPLRDNPVRGAAGFSASIAFTDVSSTGTAWAGFVTTSSADLPSLTPASLVGPAFVTAIPGLGQGVPLPASVVLYTSPGLGIGQPIKPRALGQAQSGPRFTAAWAGRGSLDPTLVLRSTDVLGALSSFDYAQDLGPVFAPHPFVADVTDVNGNGLCSTCPLGTEQVPDYASFETLAFSPRRAQALRTEVRLPPLPAAFSTVLVAGAVVDPFAGLLPTGFSSGTPGAVAADGSRAVAPLTLRSGAPYGGLELARPGIWALASNAAGTAFSGRLVTASSLPTSLSVKALLPAPSGNTYTRASRSLALGQPAWSALVSSGARLAQVALIGSEVRHVIYFTTDPAQQTVAWPVPPAGPGVDPAGEASSSLSVVAIEPTDGTIPEDLFGFGGVDLSTLCTVVGGYARADGP